MPIGVNWHVKRVFRTEWHAPLGAFIGLGSFATFAAMSTGAKGWVGRGVGLMLAVAFGWFFIGRMARAGVYLADGFVQIVNPFRTWRFGQAEVARFELGEYGLFSPIGFVVLKDGFRLHLWGIQGTASVAAAEKLVDSLNEAVRGRSSPQ